MKNLLVTSALPYANGPIHLGHLMEAVQTDIFVRYHNLKGNKAYYFCADDTHGTPIMIAAKKEGITPETLVGKIQKEHLRDLESFSIHYDNYYSTNTIENKFFSEDIYNNLKMKGNIAEREIQQSYCEHDKMFLPDRFIKGTCPKCGAQNQYGDGCEVCGANYSPNDLKDSKCSICNNTPVTKSSKHLFFKLQDYEKELLDWISNDNHIAQSIKNKLLEWFKEGLKEWDISRDGPYFGFEIPGEVNKYFYVWLDAPIGYMASSKNYFQKTKPEEFDKFWRSTNFDVIHFIGKDILYFHTLFWPAMLMGAGYRTPTRVNVHGFMTINGEKMSKSRGTFIKASSYIKYLDSEHFRFYLAGKLNDTLDDLDLNFEDFVSKVNSDLIGNFINIFSRVGTSILDKLDRRLGVLSNEGIELLNTCISSQDMISNYYETLNYSKLMKEILRLGDKINKYVNDKTPWIVIKEDKEKAREIVTDVINSGRILAIYLAPILPRITKDIFEFLNIEKNSLNDLNEKLENCNIKEYKILSKRVDEKAIEKLIEESKEEKAMDSLNTTTENEKKLSNVINIDDLAKVELRVGQILEANHVEGSDKLIQVKVDLGEKGIKNVFAGIKKSYSVEDLTNLKVVVVSNLAPRKMKFGTSEAMLLASGKDDSLSLFIPHRNANPGDLLK
jgi:methionyl-tRNA synthetase